ncbi:MAG: response regulator transcription factor [Myxococcota bacterium]
MTRVMLVEDDQDLRLVLRDGLVARGHVVWAFGNGRDALSAWVDGLKERAEVALIDLHLPDMDGTRLAEKLRAVDRRVGIVFLTGDSVSRAQVLDLVLTKPVDFEEIGRALVQLHVARWAHPEDSLGRFHELI